MIGKQSKRSLSFSPRLRLVALGGLAPLLWLLPEALADMNEPGSARLIEQTRISPGLDELTEPDDHALQSYLNPGTSLLGMASGPSRSQKPLSVVTQGVLKRGESLASVLGAKGIAPATIHQVTQEVRPLFDFRRSQPGDRFRLAQGSIGNVIDFRYSTNPEESIHLYWDGADFVVAKEQAQLSARVERIAGVVETTLYDAVRLLGESPQLASSFADLFAWDLDFSRSIQSGDEFQILYERLYRTDQDGYEVYVRPGPILAARFNGRAANLTAVFYEDEPEKGGYFRSDGSSVERSFLAAPLRFARVTSRYSSSRRHPILKVTRPHHGIDYAAPEGTPLWAVADGRVVFKGRNGGFGNLIKIEHAGGYISFYAHLSGYAQGLRVGQQVKQKEIVGYVGRTGLATGPHVCFRVTKNGRYVDPMKLNSPPGKAIPEVQWADFSLERDLLLGQLVAAPARYADESL